MGVFKWLRRERVTVTTHTVNPGHTSLDNSATQIGTIRTDEYKRDLAEFQARRSSTTKEQEVPVKKKCSRHSLPVSCTDCTADHDNTFNYEKKSAVKYKKKTQKRARSTTPDRNIYGGVPNIQFLFQNQVFMPGNMVATTSYSEPQKYKRHHRKSRSPDMDYIVQKQIDFKEDDQDGSPPPFCKNNSLPFDVKNFLDGPRSEEDVIDGSKAGGDLKVRAPSQNTSSPTNDENDDKLWEVMSELKNFDQWADEQLMFRSPNASKSDDSKSDTSAYGLPIASVRNLDVAADRNKVWNLGKWGVVPVQTKKLNGVTLEHVRKKQNTEINILRKCRHPNIILLMGLYPDIHDNVHLICERCVDSLFGILHVQGRILSAQTAIQYTLDIANALVFLRMQGFVHTDLCSVSIMITSHDAAKLADFASCAKLERQEKKKSKGYEMYSPEPQYVNISDTRGPESDVAEFEPLLSAHPSETYMVCNSVTKPYQAYENSERYRWQAPELFAPSEDGMVFPCSKSDVYSLCLILWESCNATMPWKNLTYNKLKEQYTLWKTGIPIPKDGTYPGCLLSLLQSGLTLQRHERIDLETLQNTLQNAKRDLDDLGYIIIPARLPTKQSTFSSQAWDTTSPTDSDCFSPQNVQHQAVIHKSQESSTESEKECSKSESSPLYEQIRKSHASPMSVAEKCFISDDDQNDQAPILRYEQLPDKDYSSACSTPIAKIKARIKEMDTPGSLHRSDSTEYCSILSPNRTLNFANDESANDQSAERPTAKLSRSFTPKSYKPLHIKVPDYNLDSIKPLLKERKSDEQCSYNFDIKNYSLPTTPIARSNKLRKNAWLSGELSVSERNSVTKGKYSVTPEKEACNNITDSSMEAPSPPENSPHNEPDTVNSSKNDSQQENLNDASPESIVTVRDSFTGLRRINPPPDFMSPDIDEVRDRMSSCSTQDRNSLKYKIEEDILANVNVKPLVAIHEKWIYEANRKTCRSLSLPEDNRSQISALKPASHCVDTLQKSLPQLNVKRPATKVFRAHPGSPSNGKNGLQILLVKCNHWEQFCQARDTIARSVNFTRSPEYKRDPDKGTSAEVSRTETKTDQATDTRSIEEYIRDMIRTEFQHLLHEISDVASIASGPKNEDIVNKGVANILESLNNNNEDIKTLKKESTKSFSRVKINGNNKPLLQITFSRSGENSLQVLDNCVNVTICDGTNTTVSTKDKLNQSFEDTLTEDVPINSLKRCQAFNALQEARSTEDLYIDDDLSTMQENFGGKVKLIPLHGSLHEILCEKEDECCLIKVKQENGCDTIYFRCDNSDTESRDAVDAVVRDRQDTVVFKRSISLVEERIQRVFPKEKRAQTPTRKTKADNIRVRPKSEILTPKLNFETRMLSNSSPSLATNMNDEVEVNIENVLCYQDSSSDECLKCHTDEDFEVLERKIEEDIANSIKSSLTCGCLEKISEENLSTLAEDKD